MPFAKRTDSFPLDSPGRSTVDEAFWRREAQRIHWRRPFRQVMTLERGGPHCRWFDGGITNLCYNAVDRHLPLRGGQTALIWCDRSGDEQQFSYADLHREVVAMAWILQRLGVTAGDRVLICLPVMPPALFAMLACARLGAIHVVVSAQLSAAALAERIGLSRPRLLILDGNVNRALREGGDTSSAVRRIIVGDGESDSMCTDNRAVDSAGDNGSAAMCRAETAVDQASGAFSPSREASYQRLRADYGNEPVPCRWLPAEAPSQLLFTSGTTGTPKGVVRDTGGYAVALCASLPHIFNTGEDEVFFTTADIGWVTGHSYLVWAPLLAGFTSLMVTGGGINAPGRRWWRLIARHGVTRLLTVPGAMRLARMQSETLDQALPSLRAVYLAGEPLDGKTRQWLEQGAGAPVYDHYWQTESGWPILAGQGGALRPVMDRRVSIIDGQSGRPATTGMLVLHDTLGPGGMQTLWGHDDEFVARYWRHDGQGWRYLTQDRARCDENGDIQIQGRMDDTMNIGGKRLSTAEVEHAALTVPGVAEAAAVGISHPLLGQMVQLFIVTSPEVPTVQHAAIRRTLAAVIVARCGRHGRPRGVVFLDSLPKTFSGKIIRRFLRRP
ncbi:AMP-binding protein [Sodalis sp. dw_96]|uniref:AMP-binding protein n=1 Tax=Sodalis sp. dw_96 TaxID=2719794 RepID=UPI001BD39754|nr:AMP-binding protein [Sodalis sp. dw_96]